LALGAKTATCAKLRGQFCSFFFLRGQNHNFKKVKGLKLLLSLIFLNSQNIIHLCPHKKRKTWQKKYTAETPTGKNKTKPSKKQETLTTTYSLNQHGKAKQNIGQYTTKATYNMPKPSFGTLKKLRTKILSWISTLFVKQA